MTLNILWPVRQSNETWHQIFTMVTLNFYLDLQGRPLNLNHVTVDLDPCDPWPRRLPLRWSNETWNNVFDLVTLTFGLWPSSSTLGSSTSMFLENFMTLRWTVAEMIFGLVTDRQKAMRKSPPCIRTDGVIKPFIQTFWNIVQVRGKGLCISCTSHTISIRKLANPYFLWARGKTLPMYR